MLFGGIIFWEFGRLCLWNNVGEYKYINTVVHFKFPFFEWVKQAPDNVMYFLFWAGLILSILFALGFLYRLVSILLFIIYVYITLIDVSYWNNHYYFYALILFLFTFSKANYRFSVDKWLGLAKQQPRTWNLWIMWFTVIVVFFYGGISKIYNPDWFPGLTCYHLLSNRLAELGIVWSESTIKTGAYIMTWYGCLFDLFIGFVLLKSRWFWIAVVGFLFFNISNSLLFHIGSFPFAALGTVALFMPQKYFSRHRQIKGADEYPGMAKRTRWLIGVYVAMQLLLPLRHFFIKGHVLWTGEGKLYSWHMMSASVDINANSFFMEIYDETGKVIGNEVITTDLYLNKDQKRTLGQFPFTAKQFVDFAAYELKQDGYRHFGIFPDVFVGRNGRTPKPIIGRTTDLTKVNYTPFQHNDWILLYADTE